MARNCIMTRNQIRHSKIYAHIQTIAGASLLGLLLSAAALAPAFAANDRGALRIDVEGFEAVEGKLLVALFDSVESFAADEPTNDASVEVDAPDVTITFSNLAVGDYAFKLFHDANRNGKLDTNSLGIPSEAYYFSNNASDPFSAPEWSESSFSLRSGDTTLRVTLNN